jgi:peroxiredoxin
MNYLLKYFFLLILLLNAGSSICNSSFSKDSTKIRAANKKRMLELQKMLDSVAIGKTVPDFTFVNDKGDSVQLSAFRGKIVVIDFWATWCPPCVAQFPHYDSLKIKFKEKEVVFMSISIDESKARWEKFLKKRNHTDIQLWSGPVKPSYYFTLMDYKTIQRVDPINANSDEAKKTVNSGLSIFDGVPGNFVIIGNDGRIEDSWMLPSKGSAMNDKLNELLSRSKK